MELSLKWLEIASKSGAICFGSLGARASKSRETVLNLLQNAPKNCLKVFDINLRKPFYDRQVIESALEFTTILKMNDLELPAIGAMFGLKAADQATLMQDLLRKFALNLFVTCGEHGAMATNGSEIVEHPDFSCRFATQ